MIESAFLCFGDGMQMYRILMINVDKIDRLTQRNNDPQIAPISADFPEFIYVIGVICG